MSYRSMRRTYLRSYLKSYIKKIHTVLLSLPFSRQQIFSPNSHALTNSHWRTHAHTLSHWRIWDWLKNESDVFQRLQTEQMLKAPWRFVGVKEKCLAQADAASVAYCIWHTALRPSGSTHIWSRPTPSSVCAIMQPVEMGGQAQKGEHFFGKHAGDTTHDINAIRGWM